MQNILPTACSLLLTEQCNLRCKYCFEKHKDNWMSENIATKSIDWLFENAAKSEEKQVSVTMFGGEPMLNWRVMELTFQRGYENMQETGISFNASIITNATVMSEAIYEMLQKYRDRVNLTVQLSIDGIPEVQNMYRVDTNGNSTWDRVEKNIPVWKRLFEDCPDKLSVHGCVNHKTIKYLHRNYKFFHDTWEFKKIWYIPVAEEKWTDRDVEIYKEEMNKIYNDVIATVKKDKKNLELINNKFNDILKEYNHADYIDSFIKNNYYGALHEVYNYAPLDRCFSCGQPMNSKTCGAGVNYVTITANGEVYPCHQIYFNDKEKETLLGSIFIGIDDMKRKIFLEYDAKEDFVGCEECNHNNCYRCLASNYVHKGSMFSQIKNKYCEMMKIDKYFQEKLKEDLMNMGLVNNSEKCNCNESRSCNQHSTDGSKYCDIVQNNQNIIDNDFDIKEAFDTIAVAVGEIYNKVNNIENILSK